MKGQPPTEGGSQIMSTRSAVPTDEKRALLRHFLAALAYRTQKALRDAPPDFGIFRAAAGVRTPAELVCHMTSVLGYARTLFVGGHYRPDPLPSLRAETERFHEMLEDLARHLESGTPLPEGMSPERLLQGPFSDAMTHAGQIAILRRLAGGPVAPENFIVADIDADRCGPQQAEPVSPDESWPDAPAGWTPPSVLRMSGASAEADASPEPGASAATAAEALLVELSGMPGFLAARLGSLGPEEAARAGRAGAFSPVEQCWHLADLEREGYAVRIRRLLHESEPLLPDFDGARLAEERQYRRKTLAGGLRAFGKARRSNIAALRALDPVDWSRRGSQEGIGGIRMSDLPRMMAEHDRAHKAEIDTWLLERPSPTREDSKGRKR
jgi:hypothetical protein